MNLQNKKLNQQSKKEKEYNLDERIELARNEIPFKETSEIGEVFQNMDDDSINDKGMSNIDFNARLRDSEASACVIIDELKTLGILPDKVTITRLKKRLSVSLNGQGRQEKVQIASASRTADLMGKSGGFGNMFKPRGGNNNE